MPLEVGARAVTLIPKTDIFLGAAVPAGEAATIVSVTSVGYLVEFFTQDEGGIYGDYLFDEILAEEQLSLWLQLTLDIDDDARREQCVAWVRLIAASRAADNACSEDLSFISNQAILKTLTICNTIAAD